MREMSGDCCVVMHGDCSSLPAPFRRWFQDDRPFLKQHVTRWSASATVSIGQCGGVFVGRADMVECGGGGGGGGGGVVVVVLLLLLLLLLADDDVLWMTTTCRVKDRNPPNISDNPVLQNRHWSHKSFFTHHALLVCFNASPQAGLVVSCHSSTTRGAVMFC
jgi:hypothetical protein